MADARISQLPAATTLATADIIPFTSISASETRKITAGDLGLALTTLGLSVGTATPGTPYTGQLWVNTSTNPPKLFVYNGATFAEISFHPADVGTSAGSIATNPGGSAPTNNSLGQLWLDTSQTPDELKVFDGSNFVRVDPQGITDTAAAAKYLQITNAAATYLALAGGTMTGNLTLVGDPTTNNMASNKKYVDDQIAAIPAATDPTPVGTVIFRAGNSVPTGYLEANGQAVDRTGTTAALFAVIGTTYGVGDGTNTFNLPDLRGEFIRGFDNGKGVDSGRAFGSGQSSQNLAHDHNLNVFGLEDGANRPSRLISDDDRKSVGSTDTIAVVSNGGSEARPRNIAMLPCIKT